MSEPTQKKPTQKKRPRGRPFSRGHDPRRNVGLPQLGPGNACPACTRDGRTGGVLRDKVGMHGAFIGCSNFPSCDYTTDTGKVAAYQANVAALAAAPAPVDPLQLVGESGHKHGDACPSCTRWALSIERRPADDGWQLRCPGTSCNYLERVDEPATPAPSAPSMLRTLTEPASSNGNGLHAPAAAPAALDLAASLTALVSQVASQSVNVEQVRGIVGEMMAAQLDQTTSAVSQLLESALQTIGASRPMAVQVGQLPAVQLGSVAHKALRRTLSLSLAGFNTMLVGPAGSGKTFLAEQVAEALGRDFATLSCAPGLPESALVGRMVPNLTTGQETYRETAFVRLYRNGGVFLLDEIDNSDPSTLLILNSALANGHLTLPSGERVTRHADFVLIVSANTYGHGQSREYVGRTQLDAAFLDRFAGSTLTLDYDADLERALCPESEIRDRVQAARAKARELKLRRVISTRGLLSVRRLVVQLGDSIDAALAALAEGWTPEDRSALGIAAQSPASF